MTHAVALSQRAWTLDLLDMTNVRTRPRVARHTNVREAMGLGAVAVMGAAVGAALRAAATDRRTLRAAPRLRRSARWTSRRRAVDVDPDGAGLFV